MSTLVSASISKNGYKVIVYICTNFGAFIKKVHVGMPLHYKFVIYFNL